MATLTIHTLFWPDSSSLIVDSHKKVMAHLNLPVIYHCKRERHAVWMEQVLNDAKSDVVVFLDVDCVPTTKTVIEELAWFAFAHSSFIGPAQATNCIADSSHIFAAPSCLAISLKAWENLGKPSLLENQESDVAQNLSRAADKQRFYYRAFYPIGYDKAPVEGIWQLGNFGFYGIGTFYNPFPASKSGYIYHLYQGRTKENQSLFEKRCDEIIKGTFLCKPSFAS